MHERSALETKFRNSRSTLLVVAGFSIVNIILLVFDAGIYFLFSAKFPLILFDIGLYFSEYFNNNVFLVAGAIVAFIAIAFYIGLYALTKKYKGLIIAGLVLFAADTLFLLFLILTIEFDILFILDIVFHIIILYSLTNGIITWAKLKKLPPEPVQIEPFLNETAEIVPQISTNGIQTVNPEPLTQITTTNDLNQRIIEIYKQAGGIEKFYVLQYIPANKLEAAMKSYAPEINVDETILILYDDTVFGSAKDGFILTSRRLYSKNTAEKANSATISDIFNITFNKGKLTASIKIAALSNAFTLFVTQPANKEAVFNVLQETINLLNSMGVAE